MSACEVRADISQLSRAWQDCNLSLNQPLQSAEVRLSGAVDLSGSLAQLAAGNMIFSRALTGSEI